MSDKDNTTQPNRSDRRPPRRVNDNDVRKHTQDLTREEVRELESMLRNDDGFKDEEIDQRSKKAGSPLASLGNSPAAYFHLDDEHPLIEDVLPLQFQRAGKIFWYFVPKEKQDREQIGTDDYAVAYSERGIELGKVLNRTEHIYKQVKKIDFIKNGFIRKATKEDLRKQASLQDRAEDAKKHAKEINSHLGLHMKIIRVKYTIDDSKCIVYFTAQGRVDFREFIRQLASMLHRRIEMRQIGVRDTTKMMGGLGPCGMPLCCSRFMHSFHPVSIKMAKDQGLSLNPSKLSGICGRLFCCLSYENDTYTELRKEFPKEDNRVHDPAENRDGIIVKVNVIPRTLQVKFRQKLKDNTYKYEDITVSLDRLEKLENDTYKLLPSKDDLSLGGLDDISVPVIPPELNILSDEQKKPNQHKSRRRRPQHDNRKKKTSGEQSSQPNSPRKKPEGQEASQNRHKKKRRVTHNNRQNEQQSSSRPQPQRQPAKKDTNKS